MKWDMKLMISENVKKQEQNISVKFSPVDLDLELITKFSVNKLCRSI
jgi:hypothetical protein